MISRNRAAIRWIFLLGQIPRLGSDRMKLSAILWTLPDRRWMEEL